MRLCAGVQLICGTLRLQYLSDIAFNRSAQPVTLVAGAALRVAFGELCMQLGSEPQCAQLLVDVMLELNSALRSVVWLLALVPLLHTGVCSCDESGHV